MIFSFESAGIDWEEKGAGLPVVMLHGLGCDRRIMAGCMEPVFESRPEYRRIYLDLPGMGASSAPLELASSDAILDALCAFLTKEIKGNFLLAGQSYGGYLARGVLARMPERVDGLLLLCPVVFPEAGDRQPAAKDIRSFDMAFLSGLDARERARFCGYAVVANEHTYERYREEIAAGLTAADASFLEGLKRRYSFSFDVDARIRGLPYRRPVLVLAGRQDCCVGYRDLWELCGVFPRASFAVLDLAGHQLQIERPDAFGALAADWLERCAQGAEAQACG